MLKCEMCGKEYDSERNYYVEYTDNTRKCICKDCKKTIYNKYPYLYRNYVSLLCNNDSIIKIFDTKDNLLDWIKENVETLEDGSICISLNHIIMTISGDRKSWIPKGFINPIDEIDLPRFEDIALLDDIDCIYE